jgi:hypothetical protein
MKKEFFRTLFYAVFFGLNLTSLQAEEADVSESPSALTPIPQEEILLADLAPETVIASVDGYEITLDEIRRVRSAKLSAMPAGTDIRDAALLELLIRRHWLAEAAQSTPLEETEAYQVRLARLHRHVTAPLLTEPDLERRALAETFLEVEVIDSLDIQPEDLEEMFLIFGQTLPEGTTLEEAKPMFERRLKRQAVEAYLLQGLGQAEIRFHERWLEHVARQNEAGAE